MLHGQVLKPAGHSLGGELARGARIQDFLDCRDADQQRCRHGCSTGLGGTCGRRPGTAHAAAGSTCGTAAPHPVRKWSTKAYLLIHVVQMIGEVSTSCTKVSMHQCQGCKCMVLQHEVELLGDHLACEITVLENKQAPAVVRLFCETCIWQ